MRREVVFVVFDGLTGLDLCGPLEVLTAASARLEPASRYRCRMLSVDARAVRTESGLQLLPDGPLAEPGRIDTLIVPGGSGLREPRTLATVADWLRRHAPRARRAVSVCTGIYAMAEASLLAGRGVTTHWQFAADVARRFPALRMQADSIYVRDGRFYSSGGVTAGIDLSLALVAEDHGASLALSVARELLVYLKRPGGQEQYSQALQRQTEAPERLADLLGWMQSHLGDELTVETLAERMHLSPRQLSRLFDAQLGISPARYVEQLRLDEARRRLLEPACRVQRLAVSLGYTSADAFRRAFQRRHGVAPSEYAARFATSAGAQE